MLSKTGGQKIRQNHPREKRQNTGINAGGLGREGEKYNEKGRKTSNASVARSSVSTGNQQRGVQRNVGKKGLRTGVELPAVRNRALREEGGKRIKKKPPGRPTYGGGRCDKGDGPTGKTKMETSGVRWGEGGESIGPPKKKITQKPRTKNGKTWH